jgi:kinesin family protein 2/24
MGAGESVIRNAPKRDSRRDNRDAFAAGIALFRAQQPQRSACGPGPASGSPGTVSVAVRKRPIFARELSEREFDVISCGQDGSSVTIHDARMHPDMRQRFLEHHTFRFNNVFSERASSDEVFFGVVAPLVELVRDRGGNGTVLMYGQTGSGKTFTMSHCYAKCASELFAPGPGRHAPAEAFVSFCELHGDSVHDVLHKHAKLTLLTCPNGDVMPYPAVQVPVRSAAQLHELISFACSLRATAATGVHDHSSRSHAICRIEMCAGNSLTLVDLAGSEHRIHSDRHDAQRRKESAQINSSLMKLKECVRLKAVGADYIPYRQSRLTHLLRPSFVDQQQGAASQTIIIATVSPSSKDTESSLNTLRHACIMDGQEQDETETRFVTGGTTERQDLAPIDVTAIARQNKAKRDAIRKGLAEDGPGWAPPPPVANQAREGSFESHAKAAELKDAAKHVERARRQAEVASFAQLAQETRYALNAGREAAGDRQRQRMEQLKRDEFYLHQQALADIQAKEAEKQRRAKLQREEEQQFETPSGPAPARVAPHKTTAKTRPPAPLQPLFAPLAAVGDSAQPVVVTPRSQGLLSRARLQQPRAQSQLPQPPQARPQPQPQPRPQQQEQPQGEPRVLTWRQTQEVVQRDVWADSRVPPQEKEDLIAEILGVLYERMQAAATATAAAATSNNSAEEVDGYRASRYDPEGPLNNEVEVEERRRGEVFVEGIRAAERRGGSAPIADDHDELAPELDHRSGSSPSPLSPYSPDESERRVAATVDRHAKARAAREHLIAKERERAEDRLQTKMSAPVAAAASAAAAPTASKDHALVRRLERELGEAESQGERLRAHGIKAALAKAKAAQLREQRRKEKPVQRPQLVAKPLAFEGLV